ncbi:MAG: hypothetical protein AB7E65_10650 [Syntrophotalea sp.]
MRENFTEASGLGYDPVPLEPYRSKEFFELERDRIFARAWWTCNGFAPVT